MSKRTIMIFTIFWAIIISISFTGYNTDGARKNDGGPPYNTNAPGEKTCSGPEGTSSCHSGGIADNAGLATKSIAFSGDTTYMPGQIYTVTVTISHPNRNRFGFQIVSLRNSNNANMGTVTITDVARTRSQLPTFGSFQTRNYVMHILNGTNGISNTGQWSYDWTAPSTNQGAITFYACMLAANNNNANDPGDETYFTQLTINPSITGIPAEETDSKKISIYPNPAKNTVSINYTLNKTAAFKAELINKQGKLVQVLYQDNTATGTVAEKIALAKNISPGIYFVQFTIDNDQLIKKIVIQE